MQFPEPDAKTCLLYLLRHGATDNNLSNPPRLQGSRTDPPLSVEGIAQAEAAARFLSGVSAAAVYSSPMIRSHETAEIIARPHRLHVESVKELIECDIGRWEGRDWEEIQRTEPEEYRLFMEDPAQHGHPGGESLNDLIARVTPAFERIYRAHLGASVIAATHKNVNRAYIASLLRLPSNRIRDVPQDNCGINVIAYREGKTRVITINIALHLPL